MYIQICNAIKIFYELTQFPSFLQVLAFDRDIGQNAQLNYHIKSGKGRTKFKIDNSTGIVYAQKALTAGEEYELNVSIYLIYNLIKALAISEYMEFIRIFLFSTK